MTTTKTPLLHEIEHFILPGTEEQNYFYRYIGIPSSEEIYLEELTAVDKLLQESDVPYVSFSEGISKRFTAQDMESAKHLWETYTQQGVLQIPLTTNNKVDQEEVTKRFQEVMFLYKIQNPHKHESVLKNFGVKLLIWLTLYGSKLFGKDVASKERPTTLFYGTLTEHEDYFLILLFILGVTIIYINPQKDEYFSSTNLGEANLKILKNEKMVETLPPFPHYNREEIDTLHDKVILHQEKSNEELVQIVSSMVSINAYNKDKKRLWSNVGVIVNGNGLIATNFHILDEAVSFGVIFEGEKQEYHTRHVVAQDSSCDLALLSVDSQTTPVIISQKKMYRRGEKIVALEISTPLKGTPSEGIIAGFFPIDELNLIQYTAPLSDTLSGAGIFNTFGELIGLSTNRFNDDEKVHLAIPATEIIRLINQK